MFTLSWGVKDSYQSNEYYSKDTRFLADKVRVNRIFESHEKLNICIELKDVSLEFIKAEILKNHLCIALVDATKLNGFNINCDDKNSLENVKYCEERS